MNNANTSAHNGSPRIPSVRYPVAAHPAAGDWTKFDFAVNHAFWDGKDLEHAIPVRTSNLASVVAAISDAGVECWIQGQTLAAVLAGGMRPDHDDDVAAWAADRTTVKTHALPRLIADGFRVIRDTEDITSVFRDGRYIDICWFRRAGRRVGYANKWFPQHYFAGTEIIGTGRLRLPVPSQPTRVVRYLTGRGRAYHWMYARSRPGYLRKLPRRATRRLVDTDNVPLAVRRVVAAAAPGFCFQQLSEKEFRNLLIEPRDSFNWRWRGKHLRPVTDNGRIARVGDIVDYLAPRLGQLADQVQDTDTLQPFNEPPNLDWRFWNSGNNFFANCVLFGFRRDVAPYGRFRDGTSSDGPAPYTTEYYRERPAMDSHAIARLLARHPMTARDGAIISGKHRAFAMIGRLAHGQEYLPVWLFHETSRGPQK